LPRGKWWVFSLIPSFSNLQLFFLSSPQLETSVLRLPELSISPENEINAIDEQINLVQQAIQLKREARQKLKDRRFELAASIQQASELNASVELYFNELTMQCSSLHENLSSLTVESTRAANQLSRFMQINVLNDAFYVWFSGPFGTINGFRLGKLSTHPQVNRLRFDISTF